MSIYSKVKEALTHHLDIDPETITKEDSISNDLGADEIAVIDIMMELEDTYDLHIPERKIGLRVGNIVDYIEAETEKGRKSA